MLIYNQCTVTALSLPLMPLTAPRVATRPPTCRSSSKPPSSMLRCHRSSRRPRHPPSLAQMSKFFTEHFLHGGRAFWSEKWPFWPLFQPSPDEKSRRRRRKFAHIPCFCARFLRKFCYFSRFCKHAKFSKVNAKFSKVVDFFSERSPIFTKIKSTR